jgi:hypothetical protein
MAPRPNCPRWLRPAVQYATTPPTLLGTVRYAVAERDVQGSIKYGLPAAKLERERRREPLSALRSDAQPSSIDTEPDEKVTARSVRVLASERQSGSRSHTVWTKLGIVWWRENVCENV